MLRKIVAVVILVPLAVIILAFAIANREMVAVSLGPLTSKPMELPLFLLIILLLAVGVLIGGVAAWLRQAKWRHAARRLERDVRDLRQKVDVLEGSGAASIVPEPGGPRPRLDLRPPAR